MLVAQTRDGGFALDAASLCEHVRQDDASVTAGDPVGTDAVKEGGGSRSGDVELGEARQVDHPDSLLNGPALGRDGLEPVRAPEAVALFLALRCVPFGPLPSVYLGKDRPLLLQPRVDRAGLHRPTCLSELSWEAHAVHLLVLVDRTLEAVVACGVIAEAAGVHLPYVDLGVTVHHPLR